MLVVKMSLSFFTLFSYLQSEIQGSPVSEYFINTEDKYYDLKITDGTFNHKTSYFSVIEASIFRSLTLSGSSQTIAPLFSVHR